MVEIEFSVMEGTAGDAEHLRPLLNAFEKQYHIHVNLTGIPVCLLVNFYRPKLEIRRIIPHAAWMPSRP